MVGAVGFEPTMPKRLVYSQVSDQLLNTPEYPRDPIQRSRGVVDATHVYLLT